MVSESIDLSSMNLATLFEKLHEHDMDLKRHNENENDKKKKYLALKVEEGKYSETKEDMNLLLQKFNKFLRNEKKPQRFQCKSEIRYLYMPTCL